MNLKKKEESTAVIAERLLVLVASVPTYCFSLFSFGYVIDVNKQSHLKDQALVMLKNAQREKAKRQYK